MNNGISSWVSPKSHSYYNGALYVMSELRIYIPLNESKGMSCALGDLITCHPWRIRQSECGGRVTAVRFDDSLKTLTIRDSCA